MSTFSSNVTQKIAPLYATQTFVSGSSSDVNVYTTGDGEYLELSNIVSTGGAGNGVIARVISVDTGITLYQLGNSGSTSHVSFVANKRADFIFVPPRHRLTYSNAVSSNTTIKFNGTKIINTP